MVIIRYVKSVNEKKKKKDMRNLKMIQNIIREN